MLAHCGSFCDISSDHVGRQFVFGYGVKNGYLDVRVKTFSYFCGKMKIRMRNIIVGLLCCCLGLSLSAQEREYVIVVHGGAGAMAGLENDQETTRM